jgi:cytochrome c oxidase subunit 3
MTIIAYDQIERRHETIRLGLWMFLATVTMLFAAFTSAYVVRRSGSDWHRLPLPPVLWLNTAILVASSAAVEAAARAGARRKAVWTNAAFAAAVALGVAFLAGQAVAWRQLMAAGVYLPTNPYSSFVYMMTGAHALHIVAALAVLGWGARAAWGGQPRRDPRRWELTMSVCRTFWHFLGGVWLFLLLLMMGY